MIRDLAVAFVIMLAVCIPCFTQWEPQRRDPPDPNFKSGSEKWRP